MAESDHDHDPLRSSRHTADQLGVSPRTLDDWVYNRRGPRFAKIGRARRYRQSDIDAWIDSQSVDFEADAR